MALESEIMVERWLPGEVMAGALDALLAMQARAYAGLVPERDAEAKAKRRAAKHRCWVAGVEAPPRAVMHVVRGGGGGEVDDFVAMANTFVRTILTDDGPMDVLALAGVASDPAARGRGLGKAVVLDALARIAEEKLTQSLFQTGPARGLYEKLGGVVVANRFVDRTADNPEANPWSDPFVMRLPGSAAWPGGVIDLNGPRY